MTKSNKPSIPYWRTTFSNGESEAIARAIACENVSQGPVVAEFERQLAAYLGVPHVIATTSGSMALFMSLWAAGVGPGDEVIVPNRTWVATAHAPFLRGARVKLVDVEARRPIINADLIERAITDRTKAIIPVHLCGRAADMRAINAIARRHNLVVIEDAAQALGSRNEDGLLGTQSDMGCFSFSVAKIISTGQGGFIATRNTTMYKKLLAMRTQGVGDIINAEWNQPGFNFRFTDILKLHSFSSTKERVPLAASRYSTIVAITSSTKRRQPSSICLNAKTIKKPRPRYSTVLSPGRARTGWTRSRVRAASLRWMDSACW